MGDIMQTITIDQLIRNIIEGDKQYDLSKIFSI